MNDSMNARWNERLCLRDFAFAWYEFNFKSFNEVHSERLSFPPPSSSLEQINI